jgi:hypothetical protein
MTWWRRLRWALRLELLVCIGALALSAATARATDDAQISVPSFDDPYSKTVRKLESGQTDIDYRAFRESFLDSKQFKIAASKREELDRLQRALPGLMDQSKFPEIVQTTKKILSIDYTNMRAHKILYQTYKILKDEPNRKKHHDIEIGLLTSIVKNGDGKSCKTAWPVVQVAEEYFILDMLDAKLKRQSIDNKVGLCDKMEAATEKGKAIYYFGITKVFEGNEKLLGKR